MPEAGVGVGGIPSRYVLKQGGIPSHYVLKRGVGVGVGGIPSRYVQTYHLNPFHRLFLSCIFCDKSVLRVKCFPSICEQLQKSRSSKHGVRETRDRAICTEGGGSQDTSGKTFPSELLNYRI